MPETSDKTSNRNLGRRAFLGTVGAVAGAAAFSGTAGASSGYDFVNVVEAGADPNGNESITPVIEDVIGNDTKLYFPPGEYYMDEGVRFTGFDHLWFIGDDATIVPAPADEFEGPARLFKLGTYYSPGNWLRFGNIDFDFTADNTGLRCIQAQVNDCWIHDVDIVGQHDTGTWGPMLVDIVDSGSIAAVDRVRIPNGGIKTANTAQDANPTVKWGPTGFIVSPHHEGILWVRDCKIGEFPDNGLYDSGEKGTVAVKGGKFRNSNSASIRLCGDDSLVRDATVVVDSNDQGFTNQRGIRLDYGKDCAVYNSEIVLEEPNGHAITVLSDVESATIDGTSITLGHSNESNDAAISVSEGAGEIIIDECDIEINCPGQAIQIWDGDGDALVEQTIITGNASGATGGRNAVRIERDGTEFLDNVIKQPGSDYRRALCLAADDCVVSGGTFEATHIPIVNKGSGTTITQTTSRSYDGYDSLNVTDGHVDLYWSTIYEGIRGDGRVSGYGNEFPSA